MPSTVRAPNLSGDPCAGSLTYTISTVLGADLYHIYCAGCLTCTVPTGLCRSGSRHPCREPYICPGPNPGLRVSKPRLLPRVGSHQLSGTPGPPTGREAMQSHLVAHSRPQWSPGRAHSGQQQSQPPAHPARWWTSCLQIRTVLPGTVGTVLPAPSSLPLFIE